MITCELCDGWGYTWSADNVCERCPRLCPVGSGRVTVRLVVTAAERAHVPIPRPERPPKAFAGRPGPMTPGRQLGGSQRH